MWVSLGLAPLFQRPSLRQGPGELAQTNWRSEAPQQFPVPVLIVMPCKDTALPPPLAAESVSARSRLSMAREGGEFSPAHICRAGPFLLAWVQG